MSIKKPDQTLTAQNLKIILWNTLQGVKDGTVEISKADAIAMQSREIVRVVKSQQSIICQAHQGISDELIKYATK
jgi:hypothetical protein